MSGKHSDVVRGLGTTRSSPLFQGKFARMFRSLKPASCGTTPEENEHNLKVLGSAMSADFDAPKDGKDDEESGMPALYTYFGQFIDHDITFDPASSLQVQNDPDALTDFRTPAFDLDNVYGRGKDDQPYLYNGDNTFLLGDPIGGGNPGARDLARNNAPVRRALIGDPRNDENSIVSQLACAAAALQTAAAQSTMCEPACSINSYVKTSNAGIRSYEPLPIPFAWPRSTQNGPLSDPGAK